MEHFSIPGVGGIIEKEINGVNHILVQKRCKEDSPFEYGLIEIPAGKIRAFENIYDCLRREIFEETGLTVTEIRDEDKIQIHKNGNYNVLNYEPFSCAQNIEGEYPIMVQIFICSAEGNLLNESIESMQIEWIDLLTLYSLLERESECLYPMHVHTLEKYLKAKNGENF